MFLFYKVLVQQGNLTRPRYLGAPVSAYKQDDVWRTLIFFSEESIHLLCYHAALAVISLFKTDLAFLK